MTREEKISHLKDILSEINENDNAVCYLTSEDNELIESAIEALEQESQTFEWCTDCREYDQKKHCCPRYNRVIRKAVEEMKQPKVGHWIKITPSGIYMCSECEQNVLTGDIDAYHYCHHCGAKMVKSNMSEIPTDSDSQESEKINCKSTKCENCTNHNYCDYEPQESEVNK